MIFHLINEQWTNPVFDLFMPAISYSVIWTPCFIIAALAFLIFGGFRGRAFVFCTTFALALSHSRRWPPKSFRTRRRRLRIFLGYFSFMPWRSTSVIGSMK